MTKAHSHIYFVQSYKLPLNSVYYNCTVYCCSPFLFFFCVKFHIDLLTKWGFAIRDKDS